MRSEQFVEQLCELEIDPELLRTDPRGQRWLPAHLKRAVEEHPECARELAEFVAMELALYDVHEPSDAFFTRRVLDRLPENLSEFGAIDDRRRTWILASAYALAIGVAYLLLGPLLSSGELASFVAPVHDWYHERAIEAEGVWISLSLVGLLVVTGVLTLAPTGRGRASA